MLPNKPPLFYFEVEFFKSFNEVDNLNNPVPELALTAELFIGNSFF
jgi:hypothetical protein